MHSRTLLVSVLVCLCTVVGCRQQEGAGEEFAVALDSYIEDVMERFEIPGLTLAVTRGEEVVYTGAFGVRSLDRGEPMRVDYLFHMASNSKPFVAEAEDEHVFGDGQLNAVGHYLLGENQVARAIEIFQYNVELYPDVADTSDSSDRHVARAIVKRIPLGGQKRRRTRNRNHRSRHQLVLH